MQWWNDFLTWFNSTDGQDVLVNAVVPFFAILVAGFVAAAIGRGSTKRLLTLNDRENRVAAVATLIGAARRASVWNTLSGPEQQHADHVASEADVRVRLLSVPGSGTAADWSAHEIASMKKNSVSFSFQAEQSLIEFRDRIVTWQGRPGRAKKLFKNDLELWAYEDTQTKSDIVSQQQAWAAAQVATPATAQVVPAAAAARAPQPVTAPAVHVQAPASAPAARAASADTVAFVAPNVAPTPVTGSTNDTPTVATSLMRPSAETSTPPASSPPERGDDTPSDESAEAPELVHPPRPITSRDDESTEEADRRLDEAVNSTPVAAKSATTRITPPMVGDDSR